MAADVRRPLRGALARPIFNREWSAFEEVRFMGELSQTELLRRVLVGLLEKGMTMHSALKSILADQKGSLISSLIEKMADQVWQGYSLVPIMEQHGEFFSREYIDAVRDFETTGTPGPRLTALLKK